MGELLGRPGLTSFDLQGPMPYRQSHLVRDRMIGPVPRLCWRPREP